MPPIAPDSLSLARSLFSKARKLDAAQAVKLIDSCGLSAVDRLLFAFFLDLSRAPGKARFRVEAVARSFCRAVQLTGGPPDDLAIRAARAASVLAERNLIDPRQMSESIETAKAGPAAGLISLNAAIVGIAESIEAVDGPAVDWFQPSAN